MLISTRGIVIRNVKYSESSVISKIYTRTLGMQSYMIQGIHGAKAAIKPSLLQAMTLLDLVAYHNKLKDLHRLKEARPAPVLESLPFDVNKSSIGLFMSEIIYKTIREEEPNEPLFDFIEECIIYLDESETTQPLLPVFFMLELSKHLGFYPHNNIDEDNYYFHLKEGYFSPNSGIENEVISPPHSKYLSLLLECTLETLKDLHIPKTSRQILLENLCTYYSLHIEGFSHVKSLQVLTSTLRG